MNDLPEYWWRVEVDSAGEIISCEQVDDAKIGTARVAYVWGKSRADIVEKAKAWHKRHRRYQRISGKRLAAKRKKAGLCRHCDKPICPESTYACREHLEKHREANRRYRNGETTPRVPADSVALRAKQLAQFRMRARLSEQLPELLRKYDELDGTASPFRSWLEREIAARDGAPLLRLVRTG